MSTSLREGAVIGASGHWSTTTAYKVHASSVLGKRDIQRLPL